MWRENEKVLIAARPSPTTTSQGYFGIPGATKPNGRIECEKWETCRDRFQKSGAKLDRFWFRTIDGPNVSAFMDKVEIQLGLKKKSQFGPTSCPDAIWVRWAPFWRKYSVRRSLFTALLRVASGYNREADNYEETLQKDTKYLRNTRPAFDYFMEGNTVFTNGTLGCPGWKSVFYNKTIEQLPNLLRKPVKPASP